MSDDYQGLMNEDADRGQEIKCRHDWRLRSEAY
jgi:hypothetical protein